MCKRWLREKGCLGLLQKGLTHSCLLGDYISIRCSLFAQLYNSLPYSNYISKAKLPDPYSAHLYLNVNGRPRQSGSTSKMIWRIPHILSAISEVMTLEKGDLVLTGTPKGVGSVAPGDVITAGVLVDGKELDEGKIEVTVEDRDGGYAFKEG